MTNINQDSGLSAPVYGPVTPSVSGLSVRIIAGSLSLVALLFLLNNYLNFGRDWPGVPQLFWASSEGDSQVSYLGMYQFFFYLAGILGVISYTLMTKSRSLRQDAAIWTTLSRYIIRACFWAVLLIGFTDMLISMLRIEGGLEAVVGESLSTNLASPQFRGIYVHFPLALIAFGISAVTSSLGFIWLSLLVVVAEFLIVICRFVFSYEQAFMGDLVRFWYAALFLFASAYTLIDEGHVRVDVLYGHLKDNAKAWCNITGIALLGLPLCWMILLLGMWTKGSSINSPLFSFEISQSVYGMYVKYLMAVFLVVFAVSMIIQFASYLLTNVANLHGEPDDGTQPQKAEEFPAPTDETI